MKVDAVEAGSCRLRMTVRAEADETRPEYDAVVRHFVQRGGVPGFRAGKVPMDVIKRTFGNEIREEVNSRLVRSLYRRAVEQERIRVVSLVNVEDVQFSPETGMAAVFVVDVEPTVDVPDYRKAPVKFAAPAVTEDEVDAQVQRVREAFAKFDKAPADYPAQRDDLVSIDFEGKVNGQPMKEVAPEAAAIAEGKAHWTLLNDERFLPELVMELVGMRAGESKRAEFTLGDYLPDALKGQPAVFSLAVNEVRRRVLPTDDEMLQQVKGESMEAFREMARKSLTEHATSEAMRKFETEIITYLLSKCAFDLPQSLLDEEINESLHRMAEDAGRRGMTKEDLGKHRAEIVESATAMSKRLLRVRYLLAAIGDKEQVEATDEDVNAWIEEAAPEHRMTAVQLRARIEKNDRLADVRGQVRNQKVLKMLVDSLK